MKSSQRIVLHQFRFGSHDEKVRWALDWKGVAYQRVSYLPGPHAFLLRRISGQPEPPVLEIDGRVLVGSAAVLEALERRSPRRSLLPREVHDRDLALEIERHFDVVVAPAVRTLFWEAIVHSPEYAARLFSDGKPRFLRLLYRPLVSTVLQRFATANGVDEPGAYASAHAIIDEALDFVASRSARSGYLVGDTFSVADLTCAAHLAPLCSPAHPERMRSDALPEALRVLHDRWALHPAVAWVRDRYSRDRPMRRDFHRLAQCVRFPTTLRRRALRRVSAAKPSACGKSTSPSA